MAMQISIILKSLYLPLKSTGIPATHQLATDPFCHFFFLVPACYRYSLHIFYLAGCQLLLIYCRKSQGILSNRNFYHHYPGIFTAQPIDHCIKDNTLKELPG